MQGEALTFGSLLRRYRTNAGLTQEQLAERAGLSRRGIADLERGARRAPYAHTVESLATGLGLSAADQAALVAAAQQGSLTRWSTAPQRQGSEHQADPSGDMRHNLPVPTTSLVGREHATCDIRRRLAETRLLTLTGVGGCGKTRLALEVARAEIDDYADGVWLVELGPLVDPSLVTPRIAAVLGARETAEQPLASALARCLRHRHILLVLDNCEHVLDACAQLVDGLLHACPDLRVLATSREPIGIGGELSWRVPSLALPDADSAANPEQLLSNPAVELFVQRAAAAQPRFALTPRNSSAIVQICRRLDGIPLALELAAARMEALSAEQIAQRLDQRFRLLTGGSRAAMPRQQTLAATLDWSYDLLTKAERRLFERLVVFSGGWTLEAAEAVCADGGFERDDVLDVLAHLTRKSLVVADESAEGAKRYWMLETVRDYARQKLAPRAPAQVRVLRDRHAEFVGSLVEQLLPDILARLPIEATGRDIDAFTPVDAEYDNVRAALAWWLEADRPASGIRLAGRLYRYWIQRGLEGEALRWLRALLELAGGTIRDGDGQPRQVVDRADAITLADRGKLLTGIVSVAARQGDYAEARVYATKAVAIWRELGDDLPLAVSLAELGLLAWLLGNPAEALEHLNESLRVIRRGDGDQVTVAFSTNALRNLGMVARSQGDYVRAAEYFRDSIIQARLGAATGGYTEARGLGHLARTLFLQGDVAQAKQVFSEALDVMQTERLAGHTLADCLDWLAAVADEERRTRDAAVLYGAADAQWQASGTVRYAPEQPTHAAELARVQTKLSADEFAAAWAEGHTMNREQAVAFALEQTPVQAMGTLPAGAPSEFNTAP